MKFYWRYWSFVLLTFICAMAMRPFCLMGLHWWNYFISDNDDDPDVVRRCRRCWKYQLYWMFRWYPVAVDHEHQPLIEEASIRARETAAARAREVFERANIKAGIDPIYWQIHA